MSYIVTGSEDYKPDPMGIHIGVVLKRGTECKMERKRNDILGRGTLYWHDIDTK